MCETPKSHSHRLKQLKVCVYTTLRISLSLTYSILPWCLFFFSLFIPKLIPKKSNKNLYRLQYIYLLLYVFYHGVDGNWQFFAQLEIIPSRKPILIRHQSTQAYIYTHTHKYQLFISLSNLYIAPWKIMPWIENEREKNVFSLSGRVHHRFCCDTEKHANCDTGNQ